MRYFILLLSLFVTFSVTADERKLAVITSEIDKDIRDFYLITNNDNTIDSVRWVTYTSSGQILEDVTVPAEKVIEEGVVLVYRNGYEAVRLEAEKTFDLKTGGGIILNYLYSGITGARRKHNLKVVIDQDFFAINDLKGNKVNKMFVLANWHRILGIIGVRDIQTSYQAFTELY